MHETATKKSFGNFWRSSAGEMKRLTSLTGAGILAALGMIIKSFSIPLGGISKISFTFLANALSGYLYGPLTAGFAAVVVDIIGFFIKPDGVYFFGFTLSAFVSGFIYGCWLYKRPVRLGYVIGACVTNTLVISFGLNPLWLHILMGDAFIGLVAARLPLNLIQLPINIALLYLLLRVVEKQKHLLVRN